MIFLDSFSSINQQVFLPECTDRNIELFIKREDQIHPFISGNKFRKLKYNILEAQKKKYETVLTFGGAFSNHIAATAAAGQISGLKTIGVIRGDELALKLDDVLDTNPTLRIAVEKGMQLKFISREAYRNKTSALVIAQLKKEFGDFFIIPEGGSNNLAVKGCEEIITTEDQKFDYICCAVGTGGTIAGVINSVAKKQQVIGFPALKGSFLKELIKKQLKHDFNSWELEENYHFGGYGKVNEELITFINRFKKITGVPLDPVYTGKAMYGILDMVSKKKVKPNTKILMIHTGGLQGIEGMNLRLQKKKHTIIE